MISEAGIGTSGAVTGMTGVTRFIDTGMLTVVVACVCGEPSDGGVVMLTTTVPVTVPLGRSFGSASSSTVTPSGGSTPADGRTFSHGLSVVTE